MVGIHVLESCHVIDQQTHIMLPHCLKRIDEYCESWGKSRRGVGIYV